METVIVGISHKTAPIAIREKFFCNQIQQELLLSELKNNPVIAESLILSTCNRTEIYANVLNADTGIDVVIQRLFDLKALNAHEELKRCFYTYRSTEAIKHLFRVTAGLDSLIIGERQILGQVKEAIELSRKRQIIGKYFNTLSHFAVEAGKKAHHETDISYGGVSLSWAAVNMAERVFKSLKGKTVLIIGAGKMSELAMIQIRKKELREIFVMNRTQSCAEALAQQCNGKTAAFCDIKEILAKADICICSVSAPHYILEKDTVQNIMNERDGRKLIFIDISMPRNIDPQVSSVPNVRLFYIDDLDNVVGDSMRRREAAVSEVENIIEAKTNEFYRKINKLHQAPSTDYFEPNVRQ